MAAPFQRVLVLDFETKWDSKEYTLSKMTTEEYVRDPRFGAWGCCFKWLGDSGKARWVGEPHLPEYLARIDWSTTAILAQNTMFDGAILNWRYGVKPCFYFDTLSMGRAVRGVERGNSLAKMAEDYGLPAKGRAVHSTDGMLDTLTYEIERELAEYCKHDVFLCEEIFKRLVMLERGDCGQEYPLADMSAWKYPIKELRLIDMTLRMFVEPKIELDADMLTDALHEEKETREALLNRLNITDGILASTPQFAELLRSIGVEPPTKKSPATGLPIPALAKNDALFQAMLNGEDENLALLCEARLKVKSTTERTRAQRFLDISARGPLPVPLSYYGALSGRWTAARGSAINMQNLKRGSFLRKALLAPWGYEFGVVDLSQIEPRTLAWTSDYEDLLNIFRAKGDPYATFGETMFNLPGMNKETHPVHRQSAKSGMLGAGYQLGWASFAAQLLVGFLGAPPVRYGKEFAKQLGIDRSYIERFLDYTPNVLAMGEIPHSCTGQELLVHCVVAHKIIALYRAAAYPVVGLWKRYEQLIPSALADGEEAWVKCFLFRKEEIVLPNGMSLLYPNLRQEKDDEGKKQWVYGTNATKLYPGKVCNNTNQALARIVMTDGLLRIDKRYRVVGSVHDEGLMMLPENEADEGLKWCIEQMTIEPKYLPGIPLAADGGWHKRYGLAKN